MYGYKTNKSTNQGITFKITGVFYNFEILNCFEQCQYIIHIPMARLHRKQKDFLRQNDRKLL